MRVSGASQIRLGAAVVGAVLLAAELGSAQSLTDQDDLSALVRPPRVGHTLLYGSGTAMTPHAHIAPGRPDIFVTVGFAFPELGGEVFSDGNASATLSWAGRVEGGVTSYSLEEYGAHAKVQLLEPGLSHPAIAIGALNLAGAPLNIGRHGLSNAGGAYENYFERMSPYIVASYTRRGGANRSAVWTTLTVGWGAGHFLVRNPAHNSETGRTAGVFGSAMADVTFGTDGYVRLALAHDAWDLSGFLTLFYQGFEASVGLMAIEEGSPEEGDNALNQLRFFFAVGGSPNRIFRSGLLSFATR